MRLDLFLVTNFGIQSRNKASELIKTHKVKINSSIITKSSFNVEEGDSVEILEDDFYVSRAAYKLKYFLEKADIFLENKTALDVGSSTGGFAQILLENNIKHVTCVDVGTNQLHEKIKNNPKVKFFEKCDIRNFATEIKFDVLTCDISFISIHHILANIDKLANNEIIVLFKPQFEVGIDAKRNSKGVVQDKKAIEVARREFLKSTGELKWILISNELSELCGKEGNIEEFFYFRKQA